MLILDTDVKDLMSLYNKNIFQLKGELDLVTKMQNKNNEVNQIENEKNVKELQKLSNDLLSFQKLLASQNTKLEILDEELDHVYTGNENRITNDNEFNSVEYTDEIINLIMASRTLEQSFRNGNEIESKKAFNNFKFEVNDIFSEVNKEIADLLIQNEELNNKNKELKDKFLEIDEVTYKNKMCIHCNSNFIPKFNEEKSCLYHPGKIKYFSCRGCGDDEYYTCCSKCNKCSFGCKYSKHVAEV